MKRLVLVALLALSGMASACPLDPTKQGTPAQKAAAQQYALSLLAGQQQITGTNTTIR
jgi:hypothetical protein